MARKHGKKAKPKCLKVGDQVLILLPRESNNLLNIMARKHGKKAKPRCLKVGDQVLILLPRESNNLLMQWKGPYIVESRVGVSDYRVKMGSKTKTYHVNMLSILYIPREPEVDVVHTSNKDDATIAVARLIYQDTKPELGEVTD